MSAIPVYVGTNRSKFVILRKFVGCRQRESYSNSTKQQEKMLSVSGKKKCSHCGEELGKSITFGSSIMVPQKDYNVRSSACSR